MAPAGDVVCVVSGCHWEMIGDFRGIEEGLGVFGLKFLADP